MSTINILDAGGATVAVEKPLVPGQALMASSRPVVIASDQSAIPVTANAGTGTFAVSAASLPLPSGASTSANQTALNALFPTSLGQKTMANSLAVVLASDQSSLPITPIVPSSCSRLLSAAATTNATAVKASAGTLRAIQGYNAKTSPVFLKLYNKASTPTVGTDTPVKTIYLPASSAFALEFSFQFATGIAYALTGAVADADTTALVAADILCLNIDYI